jgi:hypothetical protein
MDQPYELDGRHDGGCIVYPLACLFERQETGLIIAGPREFTELYTLDPVS